MTTCQEFADAAEATLRRIRRDRAAAPERLRPLLEHIELHLFETGYDVNRLRRECGVRDPGMLQRFRAALGKSPFAYIEDRRLETASRLLVASDLPIWRIAELLGYRSPPVFSRAFVRWSGERPSAHRRRGGPAGPAATLEQRALRASALLEEALALLRGDAPPQPAAASARRIDSP